MRKSIAGILLVLCIAGAGIAADQALGPEEFTSVDELALAINAYFPKVQGGVTAVDGDRITLSLGKKDGLIPGMELTVWREGKEILHPVTKAVLGHAEDEVGTIEVVIVGDKSSTAVMRKRVTDPKVGDRARITPKKINIALLPLRNEHADIIQGLADRLGELGRFTVLGADKVSAFLKDRKDRDINLIKDMGKAFSLDAVVAVGIYPTEGKSFVTGRVFYTDETKPLDTIVAVLDLSSKRQALGDVRPFFAPVKEVSAKMPDLPLDAKFFAAADLQGDGKLEYVFSNQKRLVVYRSESSEWKEVWTEQVPPAEQDMQQFHVDVADINGNGRPEIFVTRMLRGVVSSYVVEFQDGGFRKTADVPGFLRVITVPGRGAVLVGQDYNAEKFYAGQPREYAWSNGAYTPGPTMALPKGTTLYSFVFANFGEARPFVVSFDDDHRLVVYSGDTRLWRSEEKYFTFESVITKPASALDTFLGRGRTKDEMDRTIGETSVLMDKTRQVRGPGRMIAIDLSGDGKDDLVVAKNTPETLLGGYKGGEVEVLTWTGARLEPLWNVKDLAGPVLDLQVLRRNEGGLAVTGLVRDSGGILGKDKIRVETYTGKLR